MRATIQPAWSEASIGKALAFNLLTSRSVLVVPNCNWTGHECDLLVVEKGLRIIDVEVKISRADLKADMKKDKWWHTRPWSRLTGPGAREVRRWPDRVWKHYYALPESIWTADLLLVIPPDSGVLALRQVGKEVKIKVLRNAKPNSQAKPITPADAIDLARLASLRMWTALAKDQA